MTTFATVGTPERPLRMRMPDGSWRTYAGGTGVPLRQKQPDGSWLVVATEGVWTDTPVEPPGDS